MPALDGALEIARAGVRTGGDPRNRDFAGAHVESDGVSEELLALGYDAQTAGGLLVTLPADKALSLEAEFRARDLFLRRIGVVEDGAGVASSLGELAPAREDALALVDELVLEPLELALPPPDELELRLDVRQRGVEEPQAFAVGVGRLRSGAGSRRAPPPPRAAA